MASCSFAWDIRVMLLWVSSMIGAVAVAAACYLIFSGLLRLLFDGTRTAEDRFISGSRWERAAWLLTLRAGDRLLWLVTWNQRRMGTTLLVRAGHTQWQIEQVYVIKYAAACVVAMLLTLLQCHLVAWIDWGGLNFALVLVGALLGYVYPNAVLRGQARRRQSSILNDLPSFLDLIVLGLESGLNLQASLQLALQFSRRGPLHAEWTRVLLDIRSGQPRGHALAQLAIRTDMPSIRQLVCAITQAESSGFSVGSIMRNLSDQHRRERLMRIEKLAMRAPVKMLFPMALCIFPCTFLVLAIPVAAQLLSLH
jgi:tight adherence protein C